MREANWVTTQYAGDRDSCNFSITIASGRKSYNPEVVYTGSRGLGILRSNDGGATWDTVNNGLSARDIRALVIDSQCVREGLRRSGQRN